MHTRTRTFAVNTTRSGRHSRFHLPWTLILLGVTACGDLPTSAPVESSPLVTRTVSASVRCVPTGNNRPVCSQNVASLGVAFVDPTATIRGAGDVSLGARVYVAPFAELFAGNNAPITIGEESNVQDNVTIYASFSGMSDDDDDDEGDDDDRGAGRATLIRQIGLDDGSGVEVAERVIMAHGTTIKGPARIGVGGTNIPANPDDEQEVFLSFGAEVDGAILQRNTGISVLGRVGPGVILRSGFIVLPGKNVTRQQEADDPALGKVRLITEADVAFNEAVIEVNTALAREYARLYNDGPSNVLGINFDPGNTSFNPVRDLPVLDDVPARVPSFRNRIIGEVEMHDDLAALNAVMADRISIRCDEGEPFILGRVRRMSRNVIFHALEETPILAGDNVTYGAGAIVHGGGRTPADGGEGDEPTVLEDDVVLRPNAVVFRSLVGRGATVGRKSAVVNSTVAPGRVIGDRQIYVNDQFFGRVEW